MVDNPFLSNLDTVTVGILGAEPKLCHSFQDKLHELGLHNVVVLEMGEPVLNMLTEREFDLLYVVDSPKDMSALTFIRAARTGNILSSMPIVHVMDKASPITSEEKAFFKAYDVTVLKADLTDRNRVEASLTSIFREGKDEQSFRARMYQAKALLRQGLLEKAGEIYQRILKEDDDHIPARVGLMRASESKPQIYWEHLTKLLQKDPKNYNFHLELAERYLHDKEPHKAKNTLRALLETLKAEPETFWLNELGVICVQLKLFTFTAKIAERLREIDEGSALWKAELLDARTCVAMGDHANARLHIQRADDMAGSQKAEIENLAAILARREGKYDKAIERYENALALSSEDYRIAYNIGICYEHLGDQSSALSYYRKALQVSPSYEKALTKIQDLGGGPTPEV